MSTCPRYSHAHGTNARKRTITRTSLSLSRLRTASIQSTRSHTAICPVYHSILVFQTKEAATSACASRTHSSCISPTEHTQRHFTYISTQRGTHTLPTHANSPAATARSHKSMGASETTTKAFMRRCSLEGRLPTPRRSSGRRGWAGVLTLDAAGALASSSPIKIVPISSVMAPMKPNSSPCGFGGGESVKTMS